MLAVFLALFVTDEVVVDLLQDERRVHARVVRRLQALVLRDRTGHFQQYRQTCQVEECVYVIVTLAISTLKFVRSRIIYGKLR